MLIAGFHWLGISSESAGRLISVAFGSALVLPTAMITSRLYGNWVAYIAAILVALHPFLIGISTSVLPEMTFMFFLISGLYLIFSSLDEENIWRLSGSGVLFGLGYLTRVEGLALPFLAITFLCVVRGLSTKASLRRGIAISASFLAVVSPYILFLSIHTGHFALKGKLKANYAYQHSLLKGASLEEILFKTDDTAGTLNKPDRQMAPAQNDVTLKDRILLAVKPACRSVKALVSRLEDSLYLGELFLLGFVVLGMFGSNWSQERLMDETLLLLVLGACAGAYFIGAPIFMSRHLTPFLVILLIWVAKGVQELCAWATGSFGSNSNLAAANCMFGPAICAVPVVFLLVTSFLGNVRLDSSYDIKGEKVDRQTGR